MRSVLRNGCNVFSIAAATLQGAGAGSTRKNGRCSPGCHSSARGLLRGEPVGAKKEVWPFADGGHVPIACFAEMPQQLAPAEADFVGVGQFGDAVGDGGV